MVAIVGYSTTAVYARLATPRGWVEAGGGDVIESLTQPVSFFPAYGCWTKLDERFRTTTNNGVGLGLCTRAFPLSNEKKTDANVIHNDYVNFHWRHGVASIAETIQTIKNTVRGGWIFTLVTSWMLDFPPAT